eukprot:GFUD01091555.1.p1 GENE.GFUD01091555.1~~GFUD01091555.1.p1  ORF type:complete len:356 (+),score=84.73 GFUD01091555.1:142-1209(+)
MYTSLRVMLSEFLGTWLYLTLGGLGTLNQPYIPALTWGAALTVGSLVGGPSSHLNPAVTLGMSASGQSPLSSLPARFTGQFSGALVAGVTLVGVAPTNTVHSMVSDVNMTNMEWEEPWFTVPAYGSSVYADILTFTLAAVMFQLVFSASSGSALYHGINLATIITVLGQHIGAGLNPAREVMGRMVVSFYHWNWDVFMFYDVWAWIPLAWSFSGCLTGALLYWLAIDVPRHLETKKKMKKCRNEAEYEIPYTIDNEEIELEKLTVFLNEKPITEKPLKVPNFNKSPPQQLKNYLDDKEVSPTAIKKFCKKNSISTPELEHYLARYRAVPVDQLDLGNGVTVRVIDAHSDELEDEK